MVKCFKQCTIDFTRYAIGICSFSLTSVGIIDKYTILAHFLLGKSAQMRGFFIHILVRCNDTLVVFCLMDVPCANFNYWRVSRLHSFHCCLQPSQSNHNQRVESRSGRSPPTQ